ncbi:MAG: HEAT repeat domain-containing protein [Pseudomonas sp.]|uniref:HEAT repeat domain-containing protein n=1 Tax=Pseudomonas sp. TaxID=306 RepID=UPI00273629E4|nr:HEAT repeat domain-containing protein [Pseudomonas sp.]MDP3848675.1 HEAT repeat domain-containing protein [Pseudomonas sp.]
MSSKWLFTSAFLLELGSLLSLLSESSSLAAILTFALLHGAACLCLMAGLWPLLPRQYRQPLPWSPLFIFGLAFFIPALGVLGVAAAVFPALYFPRRQRADVWKQTAIPDLPFRATEPDMRSMMSAGGLQDVLRHAVNPNKRLSAILSTRQMSGRDAIPILKLALKDPVDDVRLLAYSMLDAQESGINLKIKQALEELHNAASDRIGQLHASLAQHYWELVYLGLAQGSVLEHMLQCARSHIEQAMNNRESADDWLLAGRIALEQRRIDEADTAFAKAQNLGMEAAQVATYRAEVAFIRRRFADIPGWLAQLHTDDRQRLPFSALARYWQCP